MSDVLRSLRYSVFALLPLGFGAASAEDVDRLCGTTANQTEFQLATANLLSQNFANRLARAAKQHQLSGASPTGSAGALSSPSRLNPVITQSLEGTSFNELPELVALRQSVANIQLFDFSLLGPRTQQTVVPEPVQVVKIAKSQVNVPYLRSEVDRCADAVRKLPRVADSTQKYACALLNVDRYCLTTTESQPHVANPEILKRAIAILVLDDVAFCTGILLNENTLRTARHCFINAVSGDVESQFTPASVKRITIETLDSLRTATLEYSEIGKLKITDGFDIDGDAVSVKIVTKTGAGANDLPDVKLVEAKEPNVLLWLAGPVFGLSQAIVMKAVAANPTAKAPEVNWRSAIRWSKLLGAQCRIRAVHGTCVYHGCQSFSGYSGSPMVTRTYQQTGSTNATIEYIGVHSGSPGIDKKHGGWPGCAKSEEGFNASDYFSFNVGNTRE